MTSAGRKAGTPPRDHAETAAAAWQRGAVQEAETAARLQLAMEPDNAQALQILGTAAGHRGQVAEALRLFRQALRSHREDPALHLNVIAALGKLGRHREALQQARKLVDLRPDDAAGRFALGTAYKNVDQVGGAEASYRAALERDPEHVPSLCGLGELLSANPTHRDEARQHLAEAHRLAPTLRLASVLLERLEGRPNAMPAVASASGGRRSGAGPAVEHPAVREWVDKGLRALGEDDREAGQCFRQALALQQDHPLAALHLARLQQRYYDAPGLLATLEQHYDTLVASGWMLDAYIWALGTSDKEDLALNELLRQAEGGTLTTAQWLAYYRLALQVADWRLWHAVEERAVRPAVTDPPAGYAWDALALPFDAAGLARLAAAQSAAVSEGVETVLPLCEVLPERARIHVGYVSGDVREHASMHLAARMITRHDRDRFKVHFYNVGPPDNSHWEATIQSGVDVFRRVYGQSGTLIAQRIRDDGVDILIDANGHTACNRVDVFALRPAPIQAHWFAMPGTIGAPWLDYFIADPFVIDTGLRQHFVEHIAYLPDCYMPTDCEQPIAEDALTRSSQGLPENGFVFACFNSTYKLTPKAFAVWMRLLREIPGSVLWLLAGSSSRQANLTAEARRRGLDPGRIVYGERVDKARHLARLALADLFLDPDLCGGHTTTIDALWAGRPVLTVLGQTFASRAPASMLRAVHLDDMICRDWPEYEQRALDLARNPARLQEVQQRLAANRLSAPLFDNERYIRNLERLYEAMLQRFREGAHRDIHLTPDAPSRPREPTQP